MKELHFESRIGKIQSTAEKVFTKLSDLSFIESLPLPSEIDKISSDRDNCYITVKGKELHLKVIEREEYKTVKFGGEEAGMGFTLWIQIKEVNENDTRFRITLKAQMNTMMKMMAEKPLKKFVDQLADTFEKIHF